MTRRGCGDGKTKRLNAAWGSLKRSVSGLAFQGMPKREFTSPSGVQETPFTAEFAENRCRVRREVLARAFVLCALRGLFQRSLRLRSSRSSPARNKGSDAGCRLFGNFEAVADASQGLQILRMAGVGFDFFAQPTDVHIDRTCRDVGSFFPNSVQRVV